jgi:hypothetical protein
MCDISIRPSGWVGGAGASQRAFNDVLKAFFSVPFQLSNAFGLIDVSEVAFMSLVDGGLQGRGRGGAFAGTRPTCRAADTLRLVARTQQSAPSPP